MSEATAAAGPGTSFALTAESVDAFLDQHLDGDTGENDDANTQDAPTPAPRRGTPPAQEDDADDEDEDTEAEGAETDEESDETDDDESDEEESEGDETDEEDESDEESDDEAEDDEEEVLSGATLKKHRERIEKDPSLKAVHRAMQADYTRKMQLVAQSRTSYESAETEYNAFAATLGDVEEGGGREKFLVDAALDNPEVFERAFERAAELLGSPEATKKYQREREVDRREERIQQRERLDAQRAAQQQVQQIQTSADRYCKQFGITEEQGVRVAKQYVANVILQKRAATGKADISDQEIKAAVQRAATDLGAVRKRSADDAKKGERKKRLEDAKETARGAKRTPPPKGKRVPGGGKPKFDPSKLDPRVDPLDARLDQLLDQK